MNLFRSSSTGHLYRTSNGHLRLKHPGYDVSYFNGALYQGSSSADIEHSSESNTPDYDKFPIALNSAIANMVSPGPYPGYNIIMIQDVYGQAGQGYTHTLSAYTKSYGTIHSVSARGGAPWGAPTVDITVHVMGGTAPRVRFGTGTVPPSGNPLYWGGTSISSSTVLENFAVGPYVWFSIYAVPLVFFDNPYVDDPDYSVEFGVVRYNPAS